MKSHQIALTSALTCALTLVFAPAAHAEETVEMSLRAAERGCNRVQDKLERTRCLYNSRRTTSRYQYQRTQSKVVRQNTLRDLRNTAKNQQLDNIRARGSDRVNRAHVRSGGRSRRTIYRNNQEIRRMCSGLHGTERMVCIRKRWRLSGADNTQ